MPRSLKANLDTILAAYERHASDPIARSLTEETVSALASVLVLLDVASEGSKAGLYRALQRLSPVGLPDNGSQLVRAMFRPVYEAREWANHIREERRAGAEVPADWPRTVAASLIRDLAMLAPAFASLTAAKVAPILRAKRMPEVRGMMVKLLELCPSALGADRVLPDGGIEAFVKEARPQSTRKAKKSTGKNPGKKAAASRLGGRRHPT